MSGSYDGLLWFLLLLGPQLILQRRLHFEIQAVLLQLTRRVEIALAIFSLLFFPGVLLHEASHFLTARLLGVRTGRFSVLPQVLANGRVRMGYVETEQTDLLRDALIGTAPVLFGAAFVAYAGLTQLTLPAVWEAAIAGRAASVVGAVSAIADRPDFWLWMYLTLTVSSTMMPSASDRRAWLPLALIFVLAVGLGVLAGAGPWLLADRFCAPRPGLWLRCWA